MHRDELRHPLRKRSLRERLWAKRPSLLGAAAVGLAVAFLAGGIWLVSTPRPFAGEPVVLADIPPVAELTTSSITSVDEPQAEPGSVDEGTLEAMEEPAPAEEEASGTVKVIRGASGVTEITVLGETGEEPQDGDDAAPGQMEAQIIMARHRPMQPAPIAAVTEETESGPLPRISARGRKPFDAYSQVTPLAVSSSGRPKIAIVLGGMGLNARLTAAAIKELPGDITFGFAPYGENLQEQVNRARARGHEILLQLPMEPVGFPASNPGPHTLQSEVTTEENLASLHWHMSRFAGYSGVTNYMGARLLVSEAALTPVMREMKDRGLVYLEDATVNLTLSPKVGEALRLPMRRASTVIDAEPTAPAIAAALERLEQEATATGFAIGTGSGLKVTIETVAEWAKTLQERGILLVPVSAAYKGRPT
jgi:polysaccharide deacetylase 2 family uncharacterized protein YibQ